jgi:hypothetical protein
VPVRPPATLVGQGSAGWPVRSGRRSGRDPRGTPPGGVRSGSARPWTPGTPAPARWCASFCDLMALHRRPRSPSTAHPTGSPRTPPLGGWRIGAHQPGRDGKMCGPHLDRTGKAGNHDADPFAIASS